MSKDLGLADHDEVRAMKVDKMLEAEHIPTEAFDVPGEGGECGDKAKV